MKLNADTLEHKLLACSQQRTSSIGKQIDCVTGTMLCAAQCRWCKNIFNLRYFAFSLPSAKSETYYNKVNSICQSIKCFHNCNSFQHRYTLFTTVNIIFYLIHRTEQCTLSCFAVYHSTCHHPFKMTTTATQQSAQRNKRS